MRPEEISRDSGQIAVLGSGPAVQALAALGLRAYHVSTDEQAREKAESLVEAGFRVIFFTEDLAAALAPLLERYRKSAVPCLVALPEAGKIRESSLRRLKELVRRAVGTDVFGQERN